MYMDTFNHIGDLFAQMGLADDPAAIEAFIEAHRPLAYEIDLWDAPWWTPSQAAFLREGLKENADWASAIDELNQRLRD